MIYVMDFGIKIYQKMPKILTASAEKKLMMKSLSPMFW
jgi:hypothetical protein